MIRRFRANESGAAAVEAALLMPFLLAATVTAADVGKALLDRHLMKTGLAAGARLLARASDPTTIETQARNLAVMGRPSGGKSRIAGWSPAQVSITYRLVANGTGAYLGGPTVRVVRVESSIPYTGFGLVNLIGGGALSVTAVHEERWTGG